MKQLFLKYKNHLMVALGILSLIFYFLSLKSPSYPKVLSFSPNDKSVSVDLRANPIYQIDKEVILSDLTLTSSPNINFQLTESNSKTFVATHTLAFQPSTTYTLTLSWQGQTIQTHSFTTLKSQEDPLLIQNMKDELAHDYPLAQKLPYTTDSYRVVYSAPMTLEITLKDNNLGPSDAISEIKSWVTKNGGDSTTHKYVIAP